MQNLRKHSLSGSHWHFYDPGSEHLLKFWVLGISLTSPYSWYWPRTPLPMCLFACISVGIYLGMELTDHKIHEHLSFKGTTKPFSRVIKPILYSTVYESSRCSTSLQQLILRDFYCCLLVIYSF